jgi:hypothetical protein
MYIVLKPSSHFFTPEAAAAAAQPASSNRSVANNVAISIAAHMSLPSTWFIPREVAPLASFQGLVARRSGLGPMDMTWQALYMPLLRNM